MDTIRQMMDTRAVLYVRLPRTQDDAQAVKVNQEIDRIEEQILSALEALLAEGKS